MCSGAVVRASCFCSREWAPGTVTHRLAGEIPALLPSDEINRRWQHDKKLQRSLRGSPFASARELSRETVRL